MTDTNPPLRITTVTGEGTKGKTFTGVVSALATSENLWSLGKRGEAVRPLMAVITASDQEFRPLIESLRAGNTATLSGADLGFGTGLACEFMRSGDYDGWGCEHALPAVAARAVHVHVKGLFSFVPPTIDEQQVKFVTMPAMADLHEMARLHAADVEDAIAHARTLPYTPRDLAAVGLGPVFVALAALWASHLQRRTIWAVPHRIAFRTQLFLACLKAGVVTLGDRAVRDRSYAFQRNWWNAGVVDFSSYVHPKLEMHPGVATGASGDFLQEVLAREVGLFDQMRRGKPAGKAA